MLVIGQTALASPDSVASQKSDALEMMERMKQPAKTNFDRWAYTTRAQSFALYYGAIGQGGFSPDASVGTIDHAAGLFYKGKFIKSPEYSMNVQVWVENESLLAGSTQKDMAKKLGTFSVFNSSTADGHSIGLEYFFIENFFFDGVWDITVGKIDALFFTAFLDYSGWDRLTFFSKTMASNPVSPLDQGFGVFTEINLDNVGFGVQVIDDAPENQYFDPVGFFTGTTYAIQPFVRGSFAGKESWYSAHSLTYYYAEAGQNTSNAKGFTYVGNQQVSDDLVVVGKASKGWGRVFKYTGAYAAGTVMLNTFGRRGDQFGFSLQANELNDVWEYGIDTYYKFFLAPWINASVNTQVYRTMSDTFVVVPGARVWLTY